MGYYCIDGQLAIITFQFWDTPENVEGSNCDISPKGPMIFCYDILLDLRLIGASQRSNFTMMVLSFFHPTNQCHCPEVSLQHFHLHDL